MLEAPLAPVVPLRTRRPARTIHTLHPATSARYTALVAAVAPAVEAALSPSVLANRVAFSSTQPAFIALRGWRSERGRFTERLSELGSGPLLLTDVRRCYASISADAVAARLRALAPEMVDAIDRLEATVRTFARLGIEGLPVGPNASAVLANAVLSVVDDALDAAGASWVRWVDDIALAIDHAASVVAVLALVDVALASVGLARNETKTRIVTDPRASAAIRVSSID